ncbi:MAG: tRNA-dihydrouridine synthase, partial [Pseudorhodobacter sp.]|nr:tRNA-dihydrouridine synthase [Pseudorhodobacter sp.]
VGRGAQGAPWRLPEIAHAVYGTPAPQIPQGAALAAVIAGHYDAILSFYGAELGLRVARKHLGWYLDVAGLEADRAALMTAASPEATLALIARTFGHGERRAA